MLKRYAVAHSHSHIVIILLSLVLGATAMALIAYHPRAQTIAASPALAQDLEAWDQMFTGVAASATPAVVTITAEQVSKGGASQPDLRDFFKDMPFKFPFGEEGEAEPSPDEKAQPRQQSKPVLGSGWIYSDDGYIVTNAHVVADCKNIKVKLHDVPNDMKEYPAKVIGSDPKTELAVIKIDAPRKLPTLALGDSSTVKIGQWVMAVGAPFRYEQTVTAGIVSAKGRKLEGESKYIQLGDIIQTDASINPGNSGGPLMDLRGSVVGINVAIAAVGMTPANVGIGFAIPANTAKRIIPDLIKNKKVTRGWLGVSIKDLNENLADAFGVEGGVLVDAVRKDGPAATSDLKANDVIIAVDGQPVKDTYELQSAIMYTAPGQTVTLDVIRSKQQVQVQVKLGVMPNEIAGLPGEAPKATTEEPEEAPAAKTVLGIRVSPVTPEVTKKLQLNGDKGVLIVDVAGDSPAVGKLVPGMVILQVSQADIGSVDEFAAAMESAKATGKSYVLLRIRVDLDGEPTSTTVDVPLQ